MKRMMSAALAATVAAGALAAPMIASAQPYGGYDRDGRYYDNGRDPCQQKKHNGSTGGAILGALAGAAIGSNIGGHGARTEGAVVGGVAGAVIGGNVGRSAANNSYACQDQRQGYYDGQRQYRQYGQNYYYQDGFYDRNGQWHRYDRRHDRRYYERYYGSGYGYDSYNYGYGRSW